MNNRSKLAIVALAWTFIFAAYDLRAIHADRRPAAKAQVRETRKDKKGDQALSEKSLKEGARAFALVAGESEWLPPASGAEAYKQRFETPERKVVSLALRKAIAKQVAQQLAPFSPVPAEKISSVAPGKMRVALTFDTERDQGTVLQILEALKAAKVKATFFVVGAWADAYPELLRRIAEDGHEIANHSYSHHQLTSLPDNVLANDLIAAERSIYAVTKKPPSRLLRPPYGSCDARVLNVAASKGFKTIMWSNDPSDWKSYQTPENVYALVERDLSDGDIVLLHTSGRATGAALPAILNKVKEMGLQQVTISELIGK